MALEPRAIRLPVEDQVVCRHWPILLLPWWVALIGWCACGFTRGMGGWSCSQAWKHIAK